MISFIICSIDPEMVKTLSDNIGTTIGCDYEIIVEDNRESPRGICEAYNEGASKARYPYLCFVHEDVLFDGDNWGGAIEQQLKEKKTGLVGFMGSTYKSKAPSGWNVYSRNNRSHFIQTINGVKRYSSEVTGAFSPCEVLDGACMFIRKEVWQENPFDTSACPGFHGYDLDMCIQVYSKGYTNYVCGTCWIEHFSEGSFSKDWALTTLYLHQSKWKDTLPFGRINSHVESRAYYVFLKNVSKLSWTKDEKESLKRIIPYKFRHPILALKSLLLLLKN